MLKTMKLITCAVLACGFGFAQQVTLSSTTLGAAITNANVTTITLASTSTMLSAGPGNQVNTALFVDREFMLVTTVVDSTHLLVRRGQQQTRPYPHVNGATVLFGITTNGVPATQFFSSVQPSAESWGACTAASELSLPKVYLVSGHTMDCLGGQWVYTNSLDHPVWGGAVASAATLIPTGTAMNVSGTTTINTIGVPGNWQPGMCLTLIPTAIWATGTSGNIRVATTAVVGKPVITCWDSVKWNSSY